MLPFLAAAASLTPGTLMLAALLFSAAAVFALRHTHAVFWLGAAWLHRRLSQLQRKPGEDGSGSVLRVVSTANGAVRL